MKANYAWAALWILPLPLVAQAPDVIPLASEPHHHLVFQNQRVNVFDAVAAPGDSILLHRHEHDAIAIAIGDQLVTVGAPGKPDVQQKNADGQVRLQRSGYVHSTHVDGDAKYFSVAVELLRLQSGARNLCVPVLADQPLNCPATLATTSTTHIDQPQFETDQTRVTVTRIRPKQNAAFGETDRDTLIIAIDESVVAAAAGKGPDTMLHQGGFVWVGQGETARVFQNHTDKEARIVTLTLKP